MPNWPFRHEEAVEHADPLAQHGDLQLVFVVEVVHEVLHRHLASVRLDRVHLEPVQRNFFIMFTKGGGAFSDDLHGKFISGMLKSLS